MVPIEEYQRQVEIAKWVDTNFKIQLPADERSLMVIGCLDMTIEHHASICLLFNAGLYGSMFTLLRSIFEAYTKSLFLRYCATEKEITFYKKDSINIEFKDLISRIETKFESNQTILSSLKKQSWKIFNSFTHSGFQQVVRRQKNGLTGSLNYSESELIEALRLSGSFALLSAVELASLAENQILIETALDKAREYSANE